MKRLILPIFFIGVLLLSCTFSGVTGSGSQGNSLLSDPQVGLKGLDDYQAALKVSFQGTQDGQSVTETDSYGQDEWSKLAAQFTTMDTLDDSGASHVILTGSVGDAQYFQADPDSPCQASWGAPSGGPSDFRFASMVPPVGAAKLVDQPTLDGVITQHYTFDAASLGLPGDVTASGEVWIAKDGGYVMKYVLDMTGADSFFGTGIQGTRHVEYTLSQVGARPEVVYPAGCDPVLDLDAMNDASDLTRLPGLLAFNTSASSDDIFAFYEGKLTALGWQKNSDLGLGAPSPFIIYNRSDSTVAAIVAVDTEGNTRRVTVMIPVQPSSAASNPASQVTPAVSTNPSARVSLALTSLLGMVPRQPAPPSFHIESINQQPVWAGGKIAQGKDEMSADVQGKNVHFIDKKTPPGGSTTTTEAYLIDKQEYAVVNGQVQPSAGISMTWTMWPLDLELMLASGSVGATAAGTETLDGRTAEVYDLPDTGSSLGNTAGIPLPVSAVTGKVWVDQQTGALLKAVLDYQADVRDNAGNDKGSGSGHLEITVTKVAQVTVTLPGK